MAFTSGHGSINVFWKDRFLIIEPESTFNIDGLIEAINAIKAQIDKRPVENWIRLVVFHTEDTVGPVDGGKYIVQSVSYGKAHGCQMVCVVGGNAMNRDGYRKVCEVVDTPFYCFDTLEKAEAFLENPDSDSVIA